jgi:IS5 family transposase
LGRIIRDIRRKIVGDEQLEAAFLRPLSRADQIRSQQQRQRSMVERLEASLCYTPGYLPGNPYDGDTLLDIIVDTQRLTGREIERAYVDKGYRGHHVENPRRVFISGQKRGVFGRIKRELRPRSAIEPVIGHMKAEGHLGRCYLKGRAGDAGDAILSAVGYMRLVLAWLRIFLRAVLLALLHNFTSRPGLKRLFNPQPYLR